MFGIDRPEEKHVSQILVCQGDRPPDSLGDDPLKARSSISGRIRQSVRATAVPPRRSMSTSVVTRAISAERAPDKAVASTPSSPCLLRFLCGFGPISGIEFGLAIP